MDIRLGILTEEDLKYFSDNDFKIINKNPSSNLVNLFIIEMITNYLFIRAEFAYSIENINHIEDKKLGNSNPIYIEIVGLINLVLKTKKLSDLYVLYQYINDFIVSYSKEYEAMDYPMPILHNLFYKYDKKTLYNIKLARSLNECFNFILSYYDLS
jgi:hypothetical protein